MHVEAKLSKFILMMPKTQVKNQESNKFQESKSRSIKNQDMQELQEKHQDKYKKNFSKSFTRVFTLW